MNYNKFEFLKEGIKSDNRKNCFKRSMNEEYARRAINRDGAYHVLPSDQPGHPGYAVVVITNPDILRRNCAN